MAAANRQSKLKDFVKTKINNNPFFQINDTKLIDNIVHATENEKIIYINGANGTGKEYLIKEVILPKLEGDLNVKKITIYDNKIP